MGNILSNSYFSINRDIKYLINKKIVEYDINRAGLQSLNNLGIISKETFNYWKNRGKDWGNIFIGSYFNKYISQSNDEFKKAIFEFISQNNISENKILSHKKDALFIYNENPKKMIINGFTFIEKNKYTSYCYSDKFEIYYNGDNDDLIIKGAGELNTHPLINQIKQFMKWFELLDKGFMKYKDVYSRIHKFKNDYVNQKLPLEYYREIQNHNSFALDSKGSLIYFSKIPEDNVDSFKLIVSYNFTNFIIPFISILSTFSPWGNKNDKR